MKSKGLALVLGAALVMGASVFTAPSVAQAVSVTSVEVTVGIHEFCSALSATCLAGPNTIVVPWVLGGALGVGPANSLILTQTGGGSNNFNFDTSDGGPGTTGCTTCNNISIRINGILIPNNQVPIPNQILAGGNVDPGNTVFNEAAGYLGWGATGGFQVDVGYADNTHTAACADGGATPNCFPGTGPGQTAADRWGPFLFLSSGGTEAPGFPSNNPLTNASHCASAAPGGTPAGCFDAGVLRIYLTPTTVPEPASLLLLGAGLMGIIAWGSRRRN